MQWNEEALRIERDRLAAENEALKTALETVLKNPCASCGGNPAEASEPPIIKGALDAQAEAETRMFRLAAEVEHYRKLSESRDDAINYWQKLAGELARELRDCFTVANIDGLPCFCSHGNPDRLDHKHSILCVRRRDILARYHKATKQSRPESVCEAPEQSGVKHPPKTPETPHTGRLLGSAEADSGHQNEPGDE